MFVKANMTIDEGVSVGPLIYARVAGRYGFLMIYLVIGTLAGIAVGSLVAVVVPFALVLSGWTLPPPILSILLPAIEVVSAITGLWIGSAQANRRYVSRYLDRLIERGHPRDADFTFQLTPASLSISGGGISHVVEWSAFLEVGAAPHHWLLITGPVSFILPKRAFATVQDERSFVAGILQNMTSEARSRSAEARALTAQG